MILRCSPSYSSNTIFNASDVNDAFLSETFFRAPDNHKQIDISKHQLQITTLVGVLIDLFFADLEGALAGPVLGILELLAKNQKTSAALASALELRATHFFLHELHDRTHLTILKGLTDTSCFTTVLNKHAALVLQYFETLMRELSAVFAAPAGSVPLSEPIVECEFAAKILMTFVTCVEPTLRAAIAPSLAHAHTHTATTTHHDENGKDVASVARALLAHLLTLMQSDQSPCNCIAPLGIAFVALFDLHTTALKDVIDAFFPDLAPSSPAVTSSRVIDSVLRLSKERSFAHTFETLSPIARVSLHRGVLIRVPVAKLLAPIRLPRYPHLLVITHFTIQAFAFVYMMIAHAFPTHILWNQVQKHYSCCNHILAPLFLQRAQNHAAAWRAVLHAHALHALSSHTRMLIHIHPRVVYSHYGTYSSFSQHSGRESTLLLGGLFPRLCIACETSVHADQWSRASVFQVMVNHVLKSNYVQYVYLKKQGLFVRDLVSKMN